jgi:di/tricarboxylate transporter
VTEFIPNEITVLIIVFGLVLVTELDIGLHFLTPAGALHGIANEALVIIAALLVVSAGLMYSGVGGYLAEHLLDLSGGNKWKMLLILLVSVAMFSAFANNTAVAIVFAGVLLKLCSQRRQSASKFLIPISYASIMGGAATLIGSSTNIIAVGIADELAVNHPSAGIMHLGMFDFTPVGGLLALFGTVFLFFTAFKLLPARKSHSDKGEADEHRFITEIEIVKEAPSIGKTVKEAISEPYQGIEINKIIRDGRIIYPPFGTMKLREGDMILIKTSANQLVKIQQDNVADISSDLGPLEQEPGEHGVTLAEFVVRPDSRYVDVTIEQSRISSRFGVNVVAIEHNGRFLRLPRNIHTYVMKVGDVLLLQGDEEDLKRLAEDGNMLMLDRISEGIAFPARAPMALGILIAFVLGAAFNVLSLFVLSVFAAMAMIITGCIPLRNAYKSLDPHVLLLIAGTISLGEALETTGAVEAYSGVLFSLTADYGPLAALAAVLVLTSILAHLIGNKPTAVIMIYVAVELAMALGVSPMPFIMGVVFGAAACFATPIGYMTNLFVYQPGGYCFGDFARIGIPLNIIYILGALFLIPIFWPFGAF